MSQNWPWFERTFDFGFPAGKMPEILERLRGTSVRLSGLVVGPSVDSLCWRESEGTWSAQENAGHLVDLEALWIGRVADIVNSDETMRAADLTNQKTATANHNQQSIEFIVDQFCDSRSHLINKVESLDPGSWPQSSKHPRLGTAMRLVDHCFFVAEHDDYHLARIRYLLLHAAQIP